MTKVEAAIIEIFRFKSLKRSVTIKGHHLFFSLAQKPKVLVFENDECVFYSVFNTERKCTIPILHELFEKAWRLNVQH